MGRGLSNSPEECYCTKLLLDGCIVFQEGKEVVVAKCTNILNSTYANCTWAMEDSDFFNNPVECSLSPLQNEEVQRPLFDFRIPLFLGIFILVAAELFGLYRRSKNPKREHKSSSIIILERLIFIYTILQPSGSIRLFYEFGVSLFILGLSMKFYNSGFWWAIYLFVVIPSAGTIIVLILKYHFIKKVKNKILENGKEQKNSLVGPITKVLTNYADSLETIRLESEESKIIPSSNLEAQQMPEPLRRTDSQISFREDPEIIELSPSLEQNEAAREAIMMAATRLTSDSNLSVEDTEEVTSFEAVDVYQDFKTPFPRLLVTFAAQASLLIIYNITVYEEEKPNFSEDITALLYYVLGALVQLVYNQSKGRERYEYDYYWLECCLRFEDYFVKEKGGLCSKVALALQLYFRVSCSLGIDLFARDLIILLLPLHLAQSESSMDFVLNAVAAYFITDLDNLSEERKLDDWKDEFMYLKESYGARVSYEEISVSKIEEVESSKGNEDCNEENEIDQDPIKKDEVTPFLNLPDDFSGDIPEIYKIRSRNEDNV